MFIRRTKSRNSTCFQIGRKRYGKFELVRHLGCASTLAGIEALRIKAKEELANIVLKNQLSLFPNVPSSLKAKLLSWQITGFHQVFGRVYNQIGFPNNLLRDLAITRIVHPKSKVATARYLERYLGISLSKDSLYRFLDTLNKDQLTQIAFDFVFRKNKGISLVFYDITTLYFETENEDDFRKKGFSKDHRSDTPQILIGLFVDSEGYPFDFDFFDGSTFEGHTFKSSVEKLIQKYAFSKPTVVADAAMLSTNNLAFLDASHIDYIVGARLKNLSGNIIKKICQHNFVKEDICQITMEGQRLLVDFSPERARKDAGTREKLIEKLKKKMAKKETLIRKSKYLLVENQGRVLGLNKEQTEADKNFDGLKGYITNEGNKNSPKEIIKQYHNLWKVEKAFRMSKNDLKERPIYHQNANRIKSHLLVCFVSLLVMKEAERILSQKHCSLEKAIEILGKVGQGKARIGNIELEIDSELDQEAKSILEHFMGH